MPPAGFEPAIPAGERLQTHTLDRSATGIGTIYPLGNQIKMDMWHVWVKWKRIGGWRENLKEWENLEEVGARSRKVLK